MITRLLLILLLLVTPPAWAIKGAPVAEETVTVSTVSIGLTSNVCKVGTNNTDVLLQVKDAAIYWNLDGVAPNSDDYEASPGDVIELDRLAWPKFRAIRSGGSDAKIKATCFW
ncbi:hypothetical protein [Candidatus Nitrospira bockiana]